MQQILTILGSVGFNWHVALANFINFLIILFLLNRFFFKKIGKTLDERHDIIERGLNQARDAEKALHEAKEKEHEIIRQAEHERDSIVKEAQIRAEDMVTLYKKEAEEGISSRLDALSLQEKEVENRVEKAFLEKAPSLVAKLYEKTLLETMTEDTNNALIVKMKSTH